MGNLAIITKPSEPFVPPEFLKQTDRQTEQHFLSDGGTGPALQQGDSKEEGLPSGGHGHPSLNPGMAPVELLNFLLLGGIVHLLLYPIPDLRQRVLIHRKVPAPLSLARFVFQQKSVPMQHACASGCF